MNGLELLPVEVPPWLGLGLIGLGFVTNAITATLGLGGGVLMLTVLAQTLPATAVIPLHAIIQVGANASRAFVMRRHVLWGILPPFLLGTVIGVTFGGFVNVSLPGAALRGLVGVFVLWTTLGQRGVKAVFAGLGLGLGGLIAAVLTMFVGATGPFTAAILRRLGLQRQAFVGTHAATMIVQHGLKILAFGLLGFAFGPWLPLAAVIMIAGFFGALLGRRLLAGLNEALFQRLLKGLLILLSLQLILSAVWELAVG